jgi:hypothetical protein
MNSSTSQVNPEYSIKYLFFIILILCVLKYYQSNMNNIGIISLIIVLGLYIIDLIQNGFQFNEPISVDGYIETNFGRIAVNFTKEAPGQINGRIKAPKFKYDDKVYSYQNPTSPGYIRFIRKSEDPNYSNKYKLVLYDDNGYSYSSNWINEESLSKRKIKSISAPEEHILNNIQGNC